MKDIVEVAVFEAVAVLDTVPEDVPEDVAVRDRADIVADDVAVREKGVTVDVPDFVAVAVTGCAVTVPVPDFVAV